MVENVLTLGDPLTFDNLGCGAAEERFEDALQKVLANILDPNTKAEAIREITLKVKVKPNDLRNEAVVLIECVPKLAPIKSFPTRIFIGQSIGGKPEAHEANANQYVLFPKVKENVTSLAAGGKEKS